MSLTKTGHEIWRDYATDGVPASGAHKPVKADIRQWADEIETELALAVARIVTGAGAIAVSIDDRLIIVDRAVSEAAAINLPAIATATGPVTIIDGAGVFDAYAQTLTPNGTDTIVGLANYPLTGKYQSITLYPYARAGADVWLLK